MELFRQTKQEIEAVLGRPIRLPSDFELLSEDIFAKTRATLSVNTLKRLFGAVKGDVVPRMATLDILAQYLGAKDWDGYLLRLGSIGNSDFSSGENSLDTATLSIGCRIGFNYDPERSVEMLHEGNGWFLVQTSEGSKLRQGDRLHVSILCLGYPLLADTVIRDGHELGHFIAGKVSGLTKLSIL